MPVLYDLHVHTTASDGILTPRQVMDKASEIGLIGIAITDHDTVEGLDPALRYKREKGLSIDFIPGIEMNTEAYGEEIHILGYFIDYNDRCLRQRLLGIKEFRYVRAKKIIDKLTAMGIRIDFNEVETAAQGDLIGRPHIAQVLEEKGYVFSIKEAFARYIGKGRPAYVPRYKFLPEEAVRLIKKAGGVPVLAHPGLLKDQRIIEKIICLGIEGIEVYYPEHSKLQINEYIKLSRARNLLITGGSDFHGTDGEGSRNRLGCTGVGPELVRELRNYCIACRSHQQKEKK